MTRLEQSSLDHVRDYWRDVKSGKWDRDTQADIARRADLDRKLGHSPRCGLLKCAPECTLAGKAGIEPATN